MDKVSTYSSLPVPRPVRRRGGGGEPLPRANRHFLPGSIWHLTHRCHEREFLLKFARDREEYIGWMLEAKKRFDLTILNDMITSNHVHLLVEGGENQEMDMFVLREAPGRYGTGPAAQEGEKQSSNAVPLSYEFADGTAGSIRED